MPSSAQTSSCASCDATAGKQAAKKPDDKAAEKIPDKPPAKTAVQPVHKPKPASPPPKYLVKVHLLQTTPVRPAGSPCYTSPLAFPATNADEVARELASEPGYTFVSMPPDRIAIYYKERGPAPPHIAEVEAEMDLLADAKFHHAEAIRVSGGSAARTVERAQMESGLTATAVDDSCILILARNITPDPVAMAALRKSLPQLYWQMDNNPPTQRLFHLDASTVAKKLTASDTEAENSGGGSGDSPKPGPASSKSGSTPAATPAGKGATQAAASSPAGSLGKKNPTDPPDPGNDANSAKNAAAGDSNQEQPDKPKPDQSTPDRPTKDSPPKPPAMRSLNDMLVYSNEDGSDRGFFERNRLIAVLDLPRPEVLMSIWSLQVSTRDPQVASLEAESAGELISHHNEVLENAVEQGWDFLSRQMAQAKLGKDFFDRRFYEYVTKKFADTDAYVNAFDPDHSTPADNSPLQNADAIGSRDRERWGWCDPDQYCLGFIHAFEPVRPTLTNILLAMIAARDSAGISGKTIEQMECSHDRFHPDTDAGVCDGAAKPQPSCTLESKSPDCTDRAAVGRFDRCVNDELRRLYTLREQSAIQDCELEDRIALLGQINSHQQEGLQLQCFKNQAQQSFSGEKSNYAATRVGLLRAAVADFLFNYKWASEYPHDFIPYDLTQSAQELNAEFNPLILAFNRDVKAFTQNLQTELECKHEANASRLAPLAWFRKGDETFLNDGMISVRGISGVESIVDTVTQSFFDATKPPSLTDLVKSVSDAENNVPGVLKTNLSANEAAVLLGAMNSVQPAQAKIGRELKLDITPHALAGASSAELEIKLTADETANPTLFKAEKQEEDTLSRVAKHDTNTRVRVESLKLFDVSAFSAELQRPRSKFPIVPPFFEVPYFGSFVGIPLRGAKVFHRSTAIVSAIIVPTAADLAFGIEFSTDRLCEVTDNPSLGLLCHHAHSPSDFGWLPLRNFHKAMVQCFASGGNTFYAGTLAGISPTNTGPADDLCSNLSLVRANLQLRSPAAP